MHLAIHQDGVVRPAAQVAHIAAPEHVVEASAMAMSLSIG